MLLITGLGNPGYRYSATRHNVGFMLLDRIAARSRGASWARLGLCLVCRRSWDQKAVVLAKPQTFMNRSGEAVAGLVVAFSLQPQQLLIVYDDADLPLGKIRIRPSGSSGGQKGMESIIGRLATEGIPRLRIGIAPDRPPDDLTRFVLSEFEAGEKKVLDEALERAVQAVETILTEGIEKAMALHN